MSIVIDISRGGGGAGPPQTDIFWEERRGSNHKPTKAPFQFALSTRAGVDGVGHTIRAATDDNPRMTVLSVDGVGACENVLRAAMLSKLREVPGLQSLLPFVRQAYSSPSS